MKPAISRVRCRQVLAVANESSKGRQLCKAHQLLGNNMLEQLWQDTPLHHFTLMLMEVLIMAVRLMPARSPNHKRDLGVYIVLGCITLATVDVPSQERRHTCWLWLC